MKIKIENQKYLGWEITKEYWWPTIQSQSWNIPTKGMHIKNYKWLWWKISITRR